MFADSATEIYDKNKHIILAFFENLQKIIN